MFSWLLAGVLGPQSFQRQRPKLPERSRTAGRGGNSLLTPDVNGKQNKKGFCEIVIIICLRLSLCHSVSPSFFLSICQSVSLSFSLSVRLSVSLSFCQSVFLSVCLSVSPSFSLSVCISLCHSVCLTVRQSLCHSVSPSFPLSVCQFV